MPDHKLSGGVQLPRQARRIPMSRAVVQAQNAELRRPLPIRHEDKLHRTFCALRHNQRFLNGQVFHRLRPFAQAHPGGQRHFDIPGPREHHRPINPVVTQKRWILLAYGHFKQDFPDER